MHYTVYACEQFFSKLLCKPSIASAMGSVWLLRGVCIAIVVLSLLAAIAVDLRANIVGHSRAYQLDRLRNWLAVGLVYMLFYQARYSATISNTDDMRERMGVSTEEYGRILTCGFWSYAAWTMINGHLLDGIGGRKGLLIGCLGCATSCIFMGLVAGRPAPSLAALLLLNAINLGFNSLAALSVIRINVNWYAQAERGVFSGIFGVMISLGYFLALTVGSWACAAALEPTHRERPAPLAPPPERETPARAARRREADLPPGGAFFLPAASLVFIAVPLCLFVVRDTPAPDQAPPPRQKPQKPASISKHELHHSPPNAASSTTDTDTELAAVCPSSVELVEPSVEPTDTESMRPVLGRSGSQTSAEEASRQGFVTAAFSVLSHGKVRAAMFGLLGVGWAREGFLSWFSSYLEELSAVQQGSTQYTLMATAMSLCGIVGSLGGGYVSDAYCGSQRGPVVVAYGAAQLACLAALHLAEGHAAASLVLVPLLSTFLFGALTLLMGAASGDFVPPHLAGMASGLLNAGQYFGSGSGALLIGWVVDSTGSWSAFPATVSLGPLVLVVSMAWLMWLQRVRQVAPQQYQ